MARELAVVDHIVFAIHPLLYEALPPDEIETPNYRVYLASEVQVKRRCLAAIGVLQPTALFIQLAGASTTFVDAARARLGPARAVHLQGGGGDDLAAIYSGLTAEILDHLRHHSLSIDAETVTSEMWGESFEGCVPGYGGAFAQGLRLQHPPRMVFEHTVCDAPFLWGARLLREVALPGSDVHAMVFELHDLSFLAVFQPRLHPLWIDHRVIAIPGMQPDKCRAITKLGYTLWPSTPPGPKGKYEDGEALQEVRFTLSDSGAANDAVTFILGLRISEQAFCDLVEGAVVLDSRAAAAM
jgi:hypothetical protein